MPTKRNKYRKIDGFVAWLCAHVVNMEKNPAGEVKRDVAVRVYTVGSRRQSVG